MNRSNYTTNDKRTSVLPDEQMNYSSNGHDQELAERAQAFFQRILNTDQYDLAEFYPDLGEYTRYAEQVVDAYGEAYQENDENKKVARKAASSKFRELLKADKQLIILMSAGATAHIEPKQQAGATNGHISPETYVRDYIKQLQAGLQPLRFNPEKAGPYARIVQELLKGYDSTDLDAFNNELEAKKTVHVEFKRAVEEPPKERTYPLHPLSYLKDRPKREWAVDHILLDKGIAAFVGDGGSGKSTFVLDMDIARACNRDFIGKTTKPAFVIWVAAESIDELYDRVIAALKCHGLTEESLTNFLILDGRMPFNFPSEVDTFIQETREQLQELGVSASTHSLTFTFDTYARCTPGADENSTQETKIIVDSMLKISEAFSAQVKTIHHVNAQGRIRGNTAFRDALDTMWVVAKEGSIIKLHCDKMRGMLEPEDFQVEMKSVLLDPENDNLDDSAPVIHPLDTSKAEACTPRVQIQMLEILQASGQLTSNAWARDCEKAHQITYSTFNNHRKYLLEAGLIKIVGDEKPEKGKRVYYTISDMGEKLLG